MTLLRWGLHNRLDIPQFVLAAWDTLMAGGGEPPFSQWAIAAQASSSLIGPVIIGLVLDSQLGWTPWATLSGVVVGFVGCISLVDPHGKSGR